MNETCNEARVVLRSDGSVHIAFENKHTVYATPANLMHLFSDPIEFVEDGYKSYEDSTFEANRKLSPLNDILGLTLATVNNDKQIVCHFPELFQCINSSSASDKARGMPLNMKNFAFETILSDEKSFLLRHYLELAGSVRAPLTIKKNIRLREEVQFAIIREILNAFFDEELPEAEPAKDVSGQIEQIEQNALLKKELLPDAEFVTVLQYAQIHNLSPYTVRKHANEGFIEGAKRNDKGHWLLPRNTRPNRPNMLKGRKKTAKYQEKAYRRPSKGSAADVEAHILKQKLFTRAVAPFIHTFDELDYYTNRNYHEVLWNGRPALIIDVNPDYRSTKDNKTNRERMQAGEAPVVPKRSREEYSYDVHHVGQNLKSPFAIIPSYDHNGGGFSSFFHQGSPNEDLHGKEFDGQRRQFWQTYIEEYDKCGDFNKIKYLNPRRKRN